MTELEVPARQPLQQTTTTLKIRNKKTVVLLACGLTLCAYFGTGAFAQSKDSQAKDSQAGASARSHMLLVNWILALRGQGSGGNNDIVGGGSNVGVVGGLGAVPHPPLISPPL